MNSKLTINEEILRFKEIYNYISNESEKIKKTYLIESTPPPAVTLEKQIEKLFKDNQHMFRPIESLIDNTLISIDRNMFNGLTSIEQKIEKIFEYYSSKNETFKSSPLYKDVKDSIYNLYKIAGESDVAFADKIFNEILNPIKKTLDKKLKEKATALGKKTKDLNRAEIDSVVDQHYNTIKSRLGDNIANNFKQKFTNYKPDIALDEALGNVINDIKNIDYRPGKPVDSKHLISNMVKFFKIFWTNWFKETTILEKEMLVLSKKVEQKIESKTMYETEMINFLHKFLELNRRLNTDVEVVLDKLIFNNTELGSDFRAKAKDLFANEPIFKEIKKVVEMSPFQRTMLATKERLRISFSTIPIISTFAKGMESTTDRSGAQVFKDMIPEWKRVRQMIFWKDARTLSETVSMMYNVGPGGTLMSKAMNFIIMQNFVIPILLAIPKGIIYNTIRNTKILKYQVILQYCVTMKGMNKVSDKENSFCKEDKLQELKEKNFMSKKDWSVFFKENLPLDYYGTTSTDGSITTRSVIKTLGCWTWMDEIGVMIYDAIFGTYKWAEEGWEDSYKLINDIISSKKTEVSSWLINNGIDPNASVDDQIKQMEEKLKNKVEDSKDKIEAKVEDVKDKITNFKEVVTSKGEEVAFNLWGQTQNPKLSFKEFGKLSDGEKDGSIVASDGKKYAIKDDGLGYENFK